MKEYSFEYTDQKYLIKLALFCFILAGASTFFIVKLEVTGLLPVITALGFPVVIFLINKKKVKKIGFSKIDNSFVEFELNGIQSRINFSEIESYLIESYNGVSLQMKLCNKTKITVTANSNFSKSDLLGNFCVDLENAIEEYKKESNNAEIIREKRFFERTWVLPFLIILSLILIPLVIYGIHKTGTSKIGSILTVSGLLISLWGGYLGAKRKK